MISHILTVYLPVLVIGFVAAGLTKFNYGEPDDNKGWARLASGWLAWPLVVLVWIIWGFWNLLPWNDDS